MIEPKDFPESRLVAVVTLPLPPNAANGTLAHGHWRSKLAAKKDYWVRCLAWEQCARVRFIPAGMIGVCPPWQYDPAPPQADLPGYVVDVSAHLYVGNKMDRDNLVARLKWAIDWLVPRRRLRKADVAGVPFPASYASDDSDEVFRLQMPSQTVCRTTTAQRVVFTLHYVSRT